MFSQFTEFLDSASKLTADFSLDNLQKGDGDPVLSNADPAELATPQIATAKPAELVAHSPIRDVTMKSQVEGSPNAAIPGLVIGEEGDQPKLVMELRGVINDLESRLSSEVALSQKKTEDMKDIRRQLRDEKKLVKELRDKIQGLEDSVCEQKRSSKVVSTRNISLEQELEEMRVVLSQSVSSVKPTLESAAGTDVTVTTCSRCMELESQAEAVRQAYDNLDKMFAAEKTASADEKNSLLAQNEALERQVSALTASLSTAMDEAAEQRRALEAEVGQLGERLSSQDQDTAIREAASMAAVSEEQEALIKYKSVLSDRDAEISRLKEEGVGLLADKDKLTAEVSELTGSVREAKERQVVLTGKMKDKIRQMMDTQSKLEGEKTALTEALRSKDSEVASLRLKFEAMENSMTDRKALSSELADRYSEAQRDIQRKREEISSLQVSVESLQSVITQKEKEVKDGNEKCNNLQNKISELEGVLEGVRREGEVKCAEAIETAQAAHNRTIDSMEVRLRELASLLEVAEGLRRSVEEERDQLRSASEKAYSSAQGLEEYKVRAQKALKQANSNAASLASRVAALEEANREAGRSAEVLAREVAGLHTENALLRSSLTSSSTEVCGLQEERERHLAQAQQLQAALEKAQSEVEAAQREKSALIAQLKQSSETGRGPVAASPGTDSDYERVPSAHPGQTRSSGLDRDADTHRVRGVSAGGAPGSSVVSGSNRSEKGARRDVIVMSSDDDAGPTSSDESVVVLGRGEDGGHGTVSSRANWAPNTSNAAVASYGGASGSGGEGGLEEGIQFDDGASSTGDLYLVTQLKDSVQALHQELAVRHSEIDQLKQQVLLEQENKCKVIRQLDELHAFHERTKQLLSSPDSAVNMEYLKKCVYRLMVTKELSERSRLYPVISTILNFTPAEARSVAERMEEQLAAGRGVDGMMWANIGDIASSSIGSFFGGGGTGTRR